MPFWEAAVPNRPVQSECDLRVERVLDSHPAILIEGRDTILLPDEVGTRRIGRPSFHDGSGSAAAVMASTPGA